MKLSERIKTYRIPMTFNYEAKGQIFEKIVRSRLLFPTHHLRGIFVTIKRMLCDVSGNGN